ncbi:lipid A deacylase LpxR family protein [Marinobacterium sp. AK62]|uniref:Lipid A deacylase LpxR family protein n=1 Tax=Marinobacterium alkalitolerans TaxID=1542925 RepID=A0ABS3ZCZ9_9GAMM|nr:lipid A deacylase LpxR family protein [Marinobacterium alkalitolerans]MBP0049579.1 lipid A deacylase LpxR family protein [Marinobacterium alkalitolerans]
MRPWLTTALLTGCALVPFQVQAEQNWTANLYFENDLFSETDQQYTNGIRVSWVSPEIESFLDDPDLPHWMRSANRWLTPLDPEPVSLGNDVSRRLIFSLGQQIYTPEDRDRRTLDPDDRPYAGWLYAGFGYHTQTRRRMNSFEVNLGMVGPAALGEEAQDFIHELRGFETFKGWDNQLKNEPGIQLIYEHKYRWLRHTIQPGWEQEVLLHAGGSLGNVATYLNGGFEYRVGYRLPHDFGTSALRPGGDNSVPGRGDPRLKHQWGIHAFVSLDARYVAQDIFLDGNTWRDSHSVDRTPWVGDSAYGIAATYGRWKLSYARVYRTRQFEQQPDNHNYGSLAVSYTF